MERTPHQTRVRAAGWGTSRQGIWRAFEQGRLSEDAATAWLLVLALEERRFQA